MKKSVLLAVVVLTFAVPALATTFVVPDDAELVAKSEAIVTGVVVSSHAEEVEPGFIVTFYDLALDRVLKGPFRAKTKITIQSPGGSTGARFMVAESAAHFVTGEEVLLFLTPYRDGWTTTDLTVGKFRFDVTSGGHGVLVRDAVDIVGWDRRGNVHREPIRRDAEFLQFVEETIAGRAVEAEEYIAKPEDVLAPPASAPPARRQPVAELVPAPAHTYTSGIYSCPVMRYPLRWETATMNAGVPWFKYAAQNVSGVGDGGVSVIQNGLAAWTNDCESSIKITYGGTTTKLHDISDNVNSIVFNDPGGHVPGTFGSSGVIAMTFPVGNVTHEFDSTDFVSIDDADIVFNNGYSGTHVSFEEAMTHELGHGIGFRHSDASHLQNCPANQCPSCTDNPCNDNIEDCSSTAIMKASVITTLGYTLQAWDMRAADALYPGTCIVVLPPANVVATATSTSSVSVSWTASAGALSYNVYRSAVGSAFTLAGSSSTTNFTDGARSADTSYLYKVRAVNGTESGDSNIDLATTTIFTDTLASGATPIKAVHVNELRTAVNAVRTLAGLSAYTFTDATITSFVTPVKAAHVTELRTALDQARAALSLPTLAYTDTITPTTTPVKAVHLNELRAGVQ